MQSGTNYRDATLFHSGYKAKNKYSPIRNLKPIQNFFDIFPL